MRDCWGHHNGYSGLMFEISTGGSLIRWRGWENGWDVSFRKSPRNAATG